MSNPIPPSTSPSPSASSQPSRPVRSRESRGGGGAGRGDSPSAVEVATLPAIQELVRQWGGDPEDFRGRLITQLIQTGLKLIPDSHDTGQVKLLTSALKEMRYA